MSGIKAESCEKHRRQEPISLRRAWIDWNGGIISFHPIHSGQLMEAEDSVFWEKVISLAQAGYRIQ